MVLGNINGAQGQSFPEPGRVAYACNYYRRPLLIIIPLYKEVKKPNSVSVVVCKAVFKIHRRGETMINSLLLVLIVVGIFLAVFLKDLIYSTLSLGIASVMLHLIFR